MRGLGTILNILLILLGGAAGLLAGNRIKPSLRESLMNVTGVGVVMLGAGGTLSKMLSVADGKLITNGIAMMIVSLSLGTAVGELIGIDEFVNQFGEWLKQKSNSSGDGQFVSSFVTASCTVCIGAMAVIGSIADGISGDYSILLVKGLLDAVIVCIMSATQGKGCIFSVIPVGILQGSITVLAFLMGNFLPGPSLENLSYVGSVLILCVGLNLMRERQIRVANTLPSILIAMIWGFFA